MPKQVKAVIMFLVLDYVYMKMKDDLERKLLVIDEAWALLGRTEDASYIFEIVKTCRKFNLGLFLINQEVEGMLDSPAGRSVLANVSYTLLLKQKPAVIEAIQKTFFLSNAERTSLLTAGVGEGLLLMENEHSEIKIVSSEAEHKQITTNADEILANGSYNPTKKKQVLSKQPKAKVYKPKVVNIKVDPKKGFFKHKDLDLENLKYLVHKKYQEFTSQSIITGKRERYLLKPRFNESPQHCFLTFEIADYIKKFTPKVFLYETKKPDVVFEINNKRYAIEVETGTILKTNKEQLRHKVELLNKEYGDNWFFVVTDKNLPAEYSKYGKTFDKRNFVSKFSLLVKEKLTGNRLPVKNQGVKTASPTGKSQKTLILPAGIRNTSSPSARIVNTSRSNSKTKSLQNLKGGATKNGKRKN